MASHARIFRPTRTAMQQGNAKTQEWMLSFAPAERRTHDPLMGWISSGDTRAQLRLRFATKEEAISYAEQNGIAYEVEEPQAKAIKPKSYAANFAWTRIR
jgi:ETC complex I subunit conserved region